MALWVCADCSTAYSVGAPACPHCGSTHSYEEGSLAKITVHGGPTHVADIPGPAPAPVAPAKAPPVADAAEEVAAPPATETPQAEATEPAPRKRTAKRQ